MSACFNWGVPQRSGGAIGNAAGPLLVALVVSLTAVPGTGGGVYSDAGASTVQLADSSNVTLIGRWAHGPCYCAAAEGSTAYFGSGGYLEIVDFSEPANPTELARMLTPSVVEDFAANAGFGYLANGSAGLRVIDMSDPANLVEVGFHDTEGYAYAVAVSGSYAYVADGTAGLQVIDVSDPYDPVIVGNAQ